MQARTERDIAKAAEALLGRSIDRLARAGEGANSQVYRADIGGERYAVKTYPQRRSDPRQRAENEWRVLHFLRDNGLNAIPRPVCYDPDSGILIMEWVEGDLVTVSMDRDIGECLAFLEQIFALCGDPGAKSFGLASEACLSGAEIERQILHRRGQFIADAALGTFLDGIFDPLLARARRTAGKMRFDEVLSPGLRRLIPADFGFHNAMREKDGGLRFIDFDYFGWDDPVKLAADFVLHPAMNLTETQKSRFVSAMRTLLPEDEDFSDRLLRHTPLYALRWALILLNPFRQDRQVDSSGGAALATTMLARQLDKARAMCVTAEAALSIAQ